MVRVAEIVLVIESVSVGVGGRVFVEVSVAESDLEIVSDRESVIVFVRDADLVIVSVCERVGGKTWKV